MTKSERIQSLVEQKNNWRKLDASKLPGRPRGRKRIRDDHYFKIGHQRIIDLMQKLKEAGENGATSK